MPEYDPEVELDLAQRRAVKLGLYVNRHRNFDPTIGGDGEYYLMPKRAYRGEAVTSLLRYTSLDQIHLWMNEYEATTGGRNGKKLRA